MQKALLLKGTCHAVQVLQDHQLHQPYNEVLDTIRQAVCNHLPVLCPATHNSLKRTVLNPSTRHSAHQCPSRCSAASFPPFSSS
jgi:hypothetical protein